MNGDQVVEVIFFVIIIAFLGIFILKQKLDDKS